MPWCAVKFSFFIWQPYHFADITGCTHGRFRCEDDHICIPLSYQCDGDRDCDDASDESGCIANCPINYFVCTNNVSVHKYIIFIDCIMLLLSTHLSLQPGEYDC